MKYCIVKSTDDIGALQDKVNKLIAEGWIPIGGVCSGTSTTLKYQMFYQAMTQETQGE